MFTRVTQLNYLKSSDLEHIWSIGEESSSSSAHVLTGTMLGSEILRVRLLRGIEVTYIHRLLQRPQTDEFRYQLADGGNGTLPYHSWIVAKGDEQWPNNMSEAEARTILAPYLQGFAFSPTALRLTRPLASSERIFGLGERTADLNKRGQAFPIWNIDPHKGHNAQTETMYTSIPFYLGLSADTGRAYGILIDHTGRVEADMGKTNSAEVSMTVEGDSLIAYFLAGPTPADVMRQYTELTGHMPLPPRWTLGYHQSRWGYTSEQQVRQLATQFRKRNHPCDAIWLDIDYMDGYRSFTWNADTFPNPKQLTEKLHAQGLHLITILDPGTKIDEGYTVYQQGMEHNYFCRYENGAIFTGNVWPGTCVFPDFSQSEVRTWWGNLYKDLLDQGVDAIWNDMDEPALTNLFVQDEPTVATKSNTMSDDVLHQADRNQPLGPDGAPTLHKFFHNAYGMEMARATYEGLRRLRPDSRPFVLTRSGTAGMQRYAALWTGDNWSRYEDILMAIPMCLNLGMSGVAFVGVDIGGFWAASNGELLVRFAQLGALLPFCRNHNAMGNPDQEPWSFAEPFESAYRTAIETRYRLLPYLYTLFREAATTGAPIIRPLYYHYPQDEQACDVQDAFLVGDVLLTAPIYEAGVTSRNVYLPAGLWFDYWTGKEYPGSGWSNIEAPLERWPLLIRGNSILPTGPVLQYVDQYPTDPLTFTCFMATDGLASYLLYEDDGTTLAYEKGSFAQISISCRVQADFVTVAIEEQFEKYRPQREEYELVVHAGGRTLQQRVKAGQGKVIIRL
ncbi:MAG: glycoside hydrolase family 31 protein [Ktedonobacteraceae bacterium]